MPAYFGLIYMFFCRMSKRRPRNLSSVSPVTLFSRSLLSVFLASASAAVLPAAAIAANAPSGAIQSIRIEGNQRIEEKTIRSYLGLKEGGAFDKAAIDKSLKDLFATGFFSDVKLLREGSALVVRVQENPVINRVAFEGNDRVEKDTLEKEIELKPRSVYTRAKVQNDVKRILDIYRRGGRYSATVEPKLIQLDQNRVDLVYEINEGPVARVKKITFIGNDVFSRSDLLEVIRTSEERWWRFLTDSDKYDQDRLQYDEELLRRYYISQGYADFQVKSAHAELSPEKDAFYLTFVLDEGPKYRFDKINVASTLKGQEQPDFGNIIKTKSGKTYDASKVEDSIDGMTKELGNRGYAFVEITPQLQRNAEAKTIDLTYAIKPGPRVYVERINITGNVRTLDNVIRREFRLAEGDPFNTSKLARTEQRLNNLGYFEKVDVKNEPGSAPDKTNINVDVQEKSTGEINLGAGFSSTDGALADFGIRETNLLGRGQEAHARFTYAARRKQAELGFTEPYFLDRELAAGFDIFRTRYDFLSESSYNLDSTGFSLHMSYALKEHLQHTITYTFRDNNITDVQSYASRYIRDQEGTNVNSNIGHALAYDTRNNRFDPTDGYYLRFSQEVAGLGGDSKYLKHEVKGSYYYPIAKNWTWSVLGSGGHMLGLGGRDILISDRFFIGGEVIRGFDNSGIGPRDVTTRDALGGNMYYAGTTELRFPLGLPEDLGFLGAAFVDAGNLWSVDASGPEVVDANKVRVAAGVGLSWASPFGPIRIDIARPIVKQREDVTQTFRFSFGTRF